jgi:beta-lactamase superfamily II metal-dependent hydrolase
MRYRLAILASVFALALLVLPGAAFGRADAASRSASTHQAGVALRVIYVDVGQGDAIILRAGSWTGLIDGGTPGSDDAIIAELAKTGAKRIDTLVITHPHADHIGGLLDVISQYKPRLAVYAAAGDTATWKNVKNALADVDAKLKQVKSGAVLAFGKLKGKVLSPASLSDDANEDSVVILLDAAERRFLFTGDLTGANEEAVGAICARGPPVYVLKVAHHGSAYSTGNSFLAQTRPRFAVICVGKNSYGHPSPETVARLKAHDARTYTTQRNGAVTVTVDTGGKATWDFSGGQEPLAAGPQR